MRKPTRAVALVALLVLSMIAVGCGGPSKPAKSTAPIATTETPATPTRAKTPVLVYFVRGESLGVVSRQVDTPQEPAAPLREALQQLVAGPATKEAAFGLGTTIPTGTKVVGVSVDGNKATVDLSKSYESGGGSLSMLLRVAQVVYTATQFPGIDRVAFRLDGTPVESIGGEGIIVSPAVNRADFEGQAPAILIESPTPDAVIASPVTIRGSANVSEAQFNAKVVDAEDTVLAEVTVGATSGTGTRGAFDMPITFGTPKTAEGTVIVYDLSEKNGTVIDEVRIPVRFRSK